MRRWLLPVLFALAASAAHAEEFTAKVIVVLDGDTVLVVRRCTRGVPQPGGTSPLPRCGNNQPEKIRLAEIDAPEKEQPGGIESTTSLSGMVLGKRVGVTVQAMDKYGRRVAQLALNGKSINEEQVRRGMAWEYSNNHSDQAYIALQREARLARRGLWAQADPVPPWRWRKLHAADVPTAARPRPATPQAAETGDFTCGGKRRCAQMRSCAEAHFYLTRCGVKALDGNGDGVPCEQLCGG